MRGILRLIDGLLGGDPFATYVLIFAVVTTLIIFVIAEIVQRRRKAKRLLEATRSGPAKPGGALRPGTSPGDGTLMSSPWVPPSLAPRPTGIAKTVSRFWRIGLAVCWAAASMVGGWAVVFGSRSFESPATLVSLGALLLCTLCLLKTTPNPIGWDSGLAPGPAGDTPGAETRPAEGSPSTFTTAGRKTSPWFLPLVLLAFLLLSILRTLAGPGLLFGLPVVGVIGLILIRQPLPRRESLYAGVLGTVACLASLASRQISGIPPAAWAALQMALVSIGLLAGWAILKRFGLQDQGVGQVRLLRDGWPSALRGFGSGALLALPWALANVAAGSSQGDSWVRAWWQPLTALQPGIAEEAWGRVLIVPFLFVLLRPFTRTRTAFGAALILAAYWFAYLHTPGGLGGIPSTLILGTLYALPLSALCLYRDLETAIGFHFLIDFIRFSAAFALYGIAGG